MMNRYTKKINDFGDIYWYRPDEITFPQESYKYLTTYWNDNYTWFRLAYMVYGDPEMYWFILRINDLTNPYAIENGDEIKILKPEYLNEVS